MQPAGYATAVACYSLLAPPPISPLHLQFFYGAVLSCHPLGHFCRALVALCVLYSYGPYGASL